MNLIKKYESGNKIDSETQKPSWLNQRIYNYVNPIYDYPPNFVLAALYGIGSVVNGGSKKYEVQDSVSDAAWRKRLGLEYDPKYLIDNGDNTFRLPANIESEIPVDTTKLKKRIAENEKLKKWYVEDMGRDPKNELITYIDDMINLDNNTLDSLRTTYKTGEPVVINEYSHNSRQLIDEGQMKYPLSPLNVLKNFTIRYNKDAHEMGYLDIYDFNLYEKYVPGKPFIIKGKVKLKKRK